MRKHILTACLLTAALMLKSAAYAQSETDKLRDALRDAISQQRALEDQMATLQAQLAQAARDKTNLQAQVDAAIAQVKKVQAQYQQAVDEFNKRLAERDDTLEKWKSAYDEAATVARTKDAERAQFQAEATAYEASTKTCRAKNTALVKVDRDLLRRLAGVYFGDKIAAQGPLIGIGRVPVQNYIQDYTDKILDQTEPACPVK